jgi:hypothetical protein
MLQDSSLQNHGGSAILCITGYVSGQSEDLKSLQNTFGSQLVMRVPIVVPLDPGGMKAVQRKRSESDRVASSGALSRISRGIIKR